MEDKKAVRNRTVVEFPRNTVCVFLITLKVVGIDNAVSFNPSASEYPATVRLGHFSPKAYG